jgi:hypothetical protein
VGGERQAALERQAAMVEELRKAELVRDRLESLEQLVRSYPEGPPRPCAPSGGGRRPGPSGRPYLPSRHLISRRASETPASMLTGGQGCLDGC